MKGKNISKLLGDYDHDLDRIMHLYGEETSKNEETVSFWSKGIQALCSDGTTFKFTSSELSEKFIYKDMIPTSIENSVALLKANKDVVDPNFFKSKTLMEVIGNSAAGWITSMFVTQQMIDNSNSNKEMIYLPLLKAVVETFLEYILNDVSDDHQLVLYSCQCCSDNEKDISFSRSVQQAGQFYASQSSVSESITPKRKTQIFSEDVSLFLQNMKDADIHLLEDYMVAKGFAVRSADHQIVKIISNIENSSKHSGVSPMKQSIKSIQSVAVNTTDRNTVSETDVARLHLKSSILQLEKRIAALDEKILGHKHKALTYKVRKAELFFSPN